MRSNHFENHERCYMLYGMFGPKVFEEADSKVNGHIRVVKDLAWGVHIQANGLTQSGGVVKSIWKSTLRQIPKSKAQNPSCLILGLGGGTAAKLIRKQWPEAKITGVDIDPIIVELGVRHLELHKSGAQVVIGDAEDFVRESKSKYGLIIMDLYQGEVFPEKFESHNFLKAVGKLLTANGIIVFNRLYFANKRPETMKFGDKLQQVFSQVDYFYPEANLMFVCSGKLK